MLETIRTSAETLRGRLSVLEARPSPQRVEDAFGWS